MDTRAPKDQQMHAKTLELLRGGMHPMDIAEQHVDYCIRYVRQLANDNGIQYERRTRSQARPAHIVEKALAMIASGGAVTQAATRYQISESTLRREVRKRFDKAQAPKPVIAQKDPEFEQKRKEMSAAASSLRWACRSGAGHFSL